MHFSHSLLTMPAMEALRDDIVVARQMRPAIGAGVHLRPVEVNHRIILHQRLPGEGPVAHISRKLAPGVLVVKFLACHSLDAAAADRTRRRLVGPTQAARLGGGVAPAVGRGCKQGIEGGTAVLSMLDGDDILRREEEF